MKKVYKDLMEMKDEVRFIAVLKGESKKDAFYEYGGFNILPVSKAEARVRMNRDGYEDGEYRILQIKKSDAEKFLAQYRGLV